MIWSEKELLSFSFVSANVIVERVYKYIDDPENIDIFNKENFSYLWGMLGVAGIRGIPDKALDKVWQTLKENDIIEAFNKGILGDYNKSIMKKYNDNRLSSWLDLDNFMADQKFKKLILMPIVAINRDYAHEVDMEAFNPVRVIGVLERYPLSEPIKQMLLDMHGHGAACGISGREVVWHYEKEKVLTRLCDIIAHSKRKFNEDEKNFLFRYIHDAVVDGFDFGLIGLSDLVFEKLMADENDETLSELELVPLKERNIEIVEFAKKFDDEYGFFELTASKLIRNNPLNISGMIERCLRLMDKTDPKGIVFALELINLKQLRSAAKILIALAKRGRATELVSFLHRLLPDANGSETMIMSILKLNLKKLREREFFDLDEVFREYPARLYVVGIKRFIEYKFYKEATTLLIELIENRWIRGFDDLLLQCRDIMNILIDSDKDVIDEICDVAKKLNFEVCENEGKVYIGEVKNNPISIFSKKAKEKLSDMIFGNNKENVLDNEVDENIIIEEFGDDRDVYNNIESYSENLDDENIKDDILINDVIDEEKEETAINLTENILSWDSNKEDDISKVNEDNNKYDEILKINEEEIENNFNKIKNIASQVIERVEQKTSEIIKRVDDKDVEIPKGLDKIKKLKEKFSFLKKK